VARPRFVLHDLQLRARGGFAVLALGSLLLSIHLWLASSVLVPVQQPEGLEWIFVSASLTEFLTLATIVAGAVALAHLLIRRVGSSLGSQPRLLDWEDAAWARPLLWFGVSAIALLSLVAWPGAVPAVLVYLVVDLRWWWTAACLAWAVARADRRLQGTLSAPIASWRRLMVARGIPEATLALLAITWVAVPSPHVRYSGGHTGDEPKYMRYLENFYQGLGFDTSQLRPLAALPANFRPQAWANVALAIETLPATVRDLAVDAAAFVAEPGRPFNRARKSDRGFVIGKNGGTYQIYNPGLSMLMFPAYYIDRTWGPRVEPRRPDQEWPEQLPAVNTFQLMLYGLWGVLIFRLLRRTVETPWAAWAAALTMTLTLPMAAFPFQVYPEVAAGVLLFASAGGILFPGGARPAASWAHGLMAGFLPWLHVRFGALSLVLGLSAAVLLRHERRRVMWFLAGFVIPWACLSLYMHRVTGSVLPTAMWVTEGSQPVLSLEGAIRGSVAYLVDRDWGLFAHSPVYLFAVAGYWWMARRRPAVALVAAIGFLALLLPAAGHTLNAAGTTPLRLIVAVIPFGAVPLAETIARYGRRPAFHALFGLALILSLDTALAYNRHLVRGMGVLVDWSASGWKTNLLFPMDSRTPWSVSAVNGFLLVFWIAVILVLPAIAVRGGARRPRLLAAWPTSRPRAALAAVLLFALCGIAVSAATGTSLKGRYLIPADEAAKQAAQQLDRVGHCYLCLDSRTGEVSTARMFAVLEGVSPSIVYRSRPYDVAFQYQEWLAMPGRIREWYADATGREPAAADIGHFLYQWHEERTSPAEIRRRIYAGAGKAPPSQ
jgi:hypothetical protein